MELMQRDGIMPVIGVRRRKRQMRRDRKTEEEEMEEEEEESGAGTTKKTVPGTGAVCRTGLAIGLCIELY